MKDGAHEQPHFDEKFRLLVEEQLGTINPEPRNDDTVLLAAPVTLEKIQRECRKLKLGKAAGYDCIQPEYLKYSGPIMHGLLQRLFQAMICLEWRPEKLKKRRDHPYSKGSKGQHCARQQQGDNPYASDW